MSLYAIGDVQGCRVPLERLLERIRFDPAHDRLVLVGDLVNRGPDSLGVVRLVRALGVGVSALLGNHDLNALAVAEGVRPQRARDTFGALLTAPDAGELLDWLRHLPLLIEHHGVIFTHAGIYPLWSLEQARNLAREAESAFSGPGYRDLLVNMYGAQPTRWEDTLEGWERLRFVINAFTRMRYVDAAGCLDFADTGPPGPQTKGLVPWFAHRDRVFDTTPVVFGHWSSLGVYTGNNVVSLDTGCVWGNRLTAVRLDAVPYAFISVACGA